MPQSPEPNARAARVEQRLTVPVLLAALISVPAMVASVWGTGAWAQAGVIVDWLAAMVLWLEWAVLFLLADRRWNWLLRHKWTLMVALLTIPALVFALGPSQLLRLVYMTSTLRVLQVRRVFKSASVFSRRLHLRREGKLALFGISTVIAGSAAALILADPNAGAWRLLQFLQRNVGPALILALLAIAMIVGTLLWRDRRSQAHKNEEPGPDDPGCP
ncbi:MAG TPA: hypothetical protein H9902_05325 [Candidatus Stackebrandtia faecavium]|nr:hypothetical protein [Candidatus Stackebrandtia faecavium]